MDHQTEEELLKSTALQNAHSIRAAKHRENEELMAAKVALELKTQELDLALAMMRATLESTTDAILVTDSDGNIRNHNRLFLTLWDIDTLGQIPATHRDLSRIFSQFVKDAQSYEETLDRIYSQSPTETYDILELQDNRVIERFSRPQLIGSTCVGRVWCYRDITETKKLETERLELLASERAARSEAEKLGYLKDEFLTTLSHELRTPLTAILGWCHIIQRDIMDPSKVLNGLEVIDRNARIQAQLVADLLDMSRIMEGKMRLDVQRVHLPEIIEEAVDSMLPTAEAKGVRIEAIIDPINDPVVGDPARLQQIMWNLLSNAVKFTPKLGKVQVVLCRINSYIEITVTDTGKGISEEFLPFLFDRFRQADASSARIHGGLGIGLALVKQLVDLHGGKIRAESPGEGKGTTFIVSLPLAATVHEDSPDRRHPRSSGKLSKLDSPDLSKMKILVVDDEKDSLEVVRRLLEECGATVTTCSSANEAIVTAMESSFDILVSDVGMPGKDGYQLVKELRQLEVTIPAVALTAFARSEDRTKALISGYQGHVAKPVEPAELLATIVSLAGHFPVRE